MDIPQANGLILSARQNEAIKKWSDTWKSVSDAAVFKAEAEKSFQNNTKFNVGRIPQVSDSDYKALKQALDVRADVVAELSNKKQRVEELRQEPVVNGKDKPKKNTEMGCSTLLYLGLSVVFGYLAFKDFLDSIDVSDIHWFWGVLFVIALILFLSGSTALGQEKKAHRRWVKESKAELGMLETEIAGLQRDYDELSGNTGRLLAKIKAELDSIITEKTSGLEEFRSAHWTTDGKQPFLGTFGDAWQNYEPILKPVKTNLPDHLTIGYWQDTTDKKNYGDLWFPMFGKQRGIILRSADKYKEVSLEVFQQLAQRLYTLLPHHSTFTFLDPLGAGAAFPMQRDVNARVQESDAYRTLDAIIKDMGAITVASALTEAHPFCDRIDKTILNAKFEFIFINDFPAAYDQRTIDKIVNIANNGYISGKYVFILYNSDQPLPRDFKMDAFKEPIILDRAFYDDQNTIKYGDRRLDSMFYKCASQEVWDQIVAHIRNFKPAVQKVEFEDVAATKEENFWTETSIDCIETTIGEGGGQPLGVWLGSKDNRNCSHGMLAAMTGAGKSNFYHALILSLAQRYSPEELSMYLIDGKQGVEFQVYKDFPHARVVSLRTSSELAGSVLEELVTEMGRRNAMFKKAGVSDIGTWRRTTSGKMPRILLIIDEYQVLFPDRTSPETVKASELLATLASQGRSAGIHILLGSQRFVVPDMQKKDSVFANIQLRIAMKMSDVSSLEEFKKEGRESIARFDQPGQIIINQNSGENGSNQIGKVVLMGKQQKDDIVAGILRKCAETGLDKSLPKTVVFDGDLLPEIAGNLQIRALKALPSLESGLRELARRSEHEGGFGKEFWNDECSAIGWMGQEFNMYGNASVVLNRDDSENVLIISDKTPARYGMLFGLLSGFCLSAGKDKARLVVADPMAGRKPYLRRYVSEVLAPAGWNAEFLEDMPALETAIGDLASEVARRETSFGDLPDPVFLVIEEPNRIRQLCRDDEGGKTPLGEKLDEICSRGSQYGIHVVLSFVALEYVRRLFNRYDRFHHKIATEMPDMDSIGFIGTKDASRLQADYVPPVGFYSGPEIKKLKFKAYSFDEDEFDSQLASLEELMKA